MTWRTLNPKLFGSLKHLDLEFVSSFVFRISAFGFPDPLKINWLNFLLVSRQLRLPVKDG